MSIEARLGFGEPVQLNGVEADDVRMLIDNIDNPAILRNEKWIYALLRVRGKFIPPIEKCQKTRKRIEEIASFFTYLEHTHQYRNSNFDEEIEVLGNVLAEAQECYQDRPEGCEMTVTSDGDCYVCNRRIFEICIP